MWVLLLLIPAALADCPTGAVYDQTFNRCYKYVSEASAFYLAEQECLSSGGNLASVSNGFENAMIAEAAKNNFGNAKNFWIGANQLLSPNWSWINGSALTYTNWAAGQPKNSSGQCVFSATATGQWSVAQCSNAAPFVCVSPSITTVKPTVVTCPTAAPIPSHCPSTWTYFADTDSCYRVGHQQNFEAAESDCVNNGAHVTSIHSTAESEFVNILASTVMTESSNTDMTWIGLQRKNNGWQWTDGTKVDFIAWQPHQPDNDHGKENCVQTFSDYAKGKSGEPEYHKWNDIDCGTTMRAYVCKKAPLH